LNLGKTKMQATGNDQFLGTKEWRSGKGFRMKEKTDDSNSS